MLQFAVQVGNQDVLFYEELQYTEAWALEITESRNEVECKALLGGDSCELWFIGTAFTLRISRSCSSSTYLSIGLPPRTDFFFFPP